MKRKNTFISMKNVAKIKLKKGIFSKIISRVYNRDNQVLRFCRRRGRIERKWINPLEKLMSRNRSKLNK